MSRKPSRKRTPAARGREKAAALASSPAAEVVGPAPWTQSLRRRLRTIFLCAVVEFAVLSGVPMRPEEIRELMQTMNQPRVVHTLPEEEESGDPDGT